MILLRFVVNGKLMLFFCAVVYTVPLYIDYRGQIRSFSGKYFTNLMKIMRIHHLKMHDDFFLLQN